MFRSGRSKSGRLTVVNSEGREVELLEAARAYSKDETQKVL